MTEDLIGELNRRGIKLRLTGGRLDVLAPAGSLTPELREQLRLQRDRLIRLLRASDAASELHEIVPRPDQRHEPFPLTDIQHAYWVGRSTAVELGGLSTHFYFELEREGLDPRRLSESLNQVIGRHDMLRAVVQPDGRQRILPDVPRYEIAVEDLGGLSAGKRADMLARTRNGMAGQAPPPERWPLFEIRASMLGGTRMRLHVSLNVLTIDAFSLSLLLRDWQRYYADPGWSPEPLELSYRDYVLASESMHAGSRYRQAEEYWLERLDTLPPAPALPLARQPAQLGSVEFTGRQARLARRDWQAIKQNARSRGLTPTAVLVTAFADALRLWSRQPSFTLNLTLFDRPPVHSHINDIIGDFTSLTMLQAEAQAGESFGTRAARLQRQLMRDLEHASFSGVRLLRERARRLGSGPDAAMPVVFTSAMSLNSQENSDAGRAFFGELVYGTSQTPQVWLDHQVTEDRGELLLSWDAVEALFPGGLLDDMFSVYRDVLGRLGGDERSWDAEEPLAALPPWQVTERARANDTARGFPPLTLCELAEATARRTPGAVAVIAGGERLSYQEVVRHAHRLARRLAMLGAQRGDLVGVVLDKGWEQVAAVLGVTEARAAYLPVEPSWPDARRDQVLAEGGVRLVVSSSRYRDELSWQPGVRVLTFDDPGLLAACADLPDDLPEPDDLAYVIFTSGSTGRPKGVMISHRGAANTIQDINSRFRVGPGDRVLALSALTFDLSVYDIFGTLAAGGTVVIPSTAGLHDPGHWTALARRHEVTIWNSVPALMQAWTADRGPGADESGRAASARPSKLRLVLLSGDWIPVSLPAGIQEHHPDAEIVSLGGATEASIWSVSYPIEAGGRERDGDRIPYGKPLANQTVHVYDERLEPCPVWTAGELYIGGVGLAMGYWANPRMTAERFIIHPKTGERLYRTGDVGRYLPGGDIEFLGRQDSQVKINGYRIELGEIAAALRRQPGVAEALVSAEVNPGTGRRQLIAHVVSSAEASLAEPSPAEPPGSADDDATAAWQRVTGDGETALRGGLSDLGTEIAVFQRWWRAMEALCPAIMARTFAGLGMFSTARQPATAADIVRRCGLKPQYTWLVGQWMSTLAADGMLQPTGRPGEYCCEEGFDAGLLDREVMTGLAAVAAGDAHRVLTDYLSGCALRQIELLRGEVSPLELLIPGGDWEVTAALYAENPVSQLQNRIAAAAVRAFVEHSAGREPVSIVEIGAGTGATTAQVLRCLPGDRVRYRFTDISTTFVNRARDVFRRYSFVDYGILDIDRDPAPQGVPPGSAGVIVAANVLHDAQDLSRTLRHLRSALAPGGVMVLVEGTANSRLQMISVAFIEGFSHHQGQHEMPLLSAPQWRERLTAEGFARFAAVPGGAVTEAMAQQVLICQAPGTRPPAASPARPPVASAARLRESLLAVLPPYMVPQHYVLIDRLPLSANGKVDRSALPAPWDAAAPSAHVAPRDALERRLLQIWRDVLGRDDFGVGDNFFELGGDSLHSIRILERLRAELGFQHGSDDGLQALLECPTVATLAVRLRELQDGNR
ncbi:MAG: amino acid adenylation domain-containing protein [Streptosporangiaceae bacterium]|nr:amino acid adenylation domain-containing protein [Streptosporangiaceae bacterium]